MQDEVDIRRRKGTLHAINRTINLYGRNPRIGTHTHTHTHTHLNTDTDTHSRTHTDTHTHTHNTHLITPHNTLHNTHTHTTQYSTKQQTILYYTVQNSRTPLSTHISLPHINRYINNTHK